MPIRCLIIDDNKSFLDAARMLLEREGLIVAGVASTVDEGLRQAASLRPDVALVDISLGEESGLELARRLAEDRYSKQRLTPSKCPLTLYTRSGEEMMQ